MTEKDEKRTIVKTNWESFALRFKAQQLGEGWGFDVFFGYRDESNWYALNLGAWGNQDAFFTCSANGSNSTYTQNRFHVQAARVYEVELKIKGRFATAVVDGEEIISCCMESMKAEPLYYSACRDGRDVIVKLVNATQNPQQVGLVLEGISEAQGRAYIMEGFEPEAVNTFDEPQKVIPVERDVEVREGRFNMEMPAYSLKVLRISPKVSDVYAR